MGMETLIGLVNRIQRACTALGDYGGDSVQSLWESLPSVVVVGGQVCGHAYKYPPQTCFPIIFDYIVFVAGDTVLDLIYCTFQIKTGAAPNSEEYSSFSFIFFFLFNMGLLICVNGRRGSEKSAHCTNMYQTALRPGHSCFYAIFGLRGDLPSMHLHLAVCCLQSSGKSSVLESIVGRDFLPRGSGSQVISVLAD